MPKGYLIAHVSVDDPESYTRYAQAATEAQKLYGARVLARGGRSEGLEGNYKARNVILEFDSYEAALNYYHSPQYQAARQHRIGKADGDFIVIEGVE